MIAEFVLTSGQLFENIIVSSDPGKIMGWKQPKELS